MVARRLVRVLLLCSIAAPLLLPGDVAAATAGVAQPWMAGNRAVFRPVEPREQGAASTRPRQFVPLSPAYRGSDATRLVPQRTYEQRLIRTPFNRGEPWPAPRGQELGPRFRPDARASDAPVQPFGSPSLTGAGQTSPTPPAQFRPVAPHRRETYEQRQQAPVGQPPWPQGQGLSYPMLAPPLPPDRGGWPGW